MDQANRILFKKPDLPSLGRQHTVVDTHFHSHYTDGTDSVAAIVEQARKKGIGIAITDHNDIRAAVELNDYSNVLTIPGIEVTSAEGSHLLVYFYDIKSLKRFYRQDVQPFMGKDVMSATHLPMIALLNRARQYRSVTIFPHPYSATYTGVCNFFFSSKELDALLLTADGIEVLNAANLHRWNMRCALLGFNLNKAIIGGSDGHQLSHMGRVVTYADCRPTRRSFLDAVRTRSARVIGKEMALINKVASNGTKLKNNFRNYPVLMEKNLRYGYKVIHLKSKTLRKSVRDKLNGRDRKKQG